MSSALSPREIQARIRSGASPAQVAADAGVDESTIEGFAGPVLAEREFMATSALGATIRRRGEHSHRRLGELVSERLQQRGIDAEEILWDAWRQEDLKWRVVGIIGDDAGTRTAEFIFDHKARYSVADNGDARWMIGEQLPGAEREDENTIDLDDELALVRATKESPREDVPDAPGDDVPSASAMHDQHEDTSELDALYDMLSGISEDSVRIYTGFEEEEAVALEEADRERERERDRAADEHEAQAEQEALPEPEEPADDQPADEQAAEADDVVEDSDEQEPAAEEATVGEVPELDADADLGDDEPTQVVDYSADEPVTEPVQDSLVEDPEAKPAPKPKKKRRRASVPSWDEIMFGGPTK